eukprot:TRINITY_DN56722_c0_g1_i1.p1 TRINITY_DN56722_c0_g1~~TRINITY_DN56722_c0_g1_i1.p1  ORF type:complete len:491 (+),score=62.50 TRINITY_DN56722_c0_g1_i1:162-1634(+)
MGNCLDSCLGSKDSPATVYDADLPTSSSSTAPPSSIVFKGRTYYVNSVLGEGTYGRVLQCQDHNNETVAVKIMSVPNSPADVAAVENEITCLQAAGPHPNIVALRDWERVPASSSSSSFGSVLSSHLARGVARGRFTRPPSEGHGSSSSSSRSCRTPRGVQRWTYSLVFQYAPVQLFDGLLDAQRAGLPGLPCDEAVRVLSDVAAALARLHSLPQPIAHRDVKAENVLRDRTGRYKLCDFGSCATTAVRPASAREIDLVADDVETHTTLVYRAPEQVDLWSKRLINTAVDVWAMGVLAYYISFFEFPFAESALAIANATTPTFRRPGHPLETFILRCLTIDPTQRPDIWECSAMLESLGGGAAVPRPAQVPVMLLADGTAPTASATGGGGSSSSGGGRPPLPAAEASRAAVDVASASENGPDASDGAGNHAGSLKDVVGATEGVEAGVGRRSGDVRGHTAARGARKVDGAVPTRGGSAKDVEVRAGSRVT